jgi:hypothetical protein
MPISEEENMADELVSSIQVLVEEFMVDLENLLCDNGHEFDDEGDLQSLMDLIEFLEELLYDCEDEDDEGV